MNLQKDLREFIESLNAANVKYLIVGGYAVAFHGHPRMTGDMDVDAGRILKGGATLDDVGREIYDLIHTVADGARTRSETLGHREFILTYKSFEPIGPSCLPLAS